MQKRKIIVHAKSYNKSYIMKKNKIAAPVFAAHRLSRSGCLRSLTGRAAGWTAG